MKAEEKALIVRLAAEQVDRLEHTLNWAKRELETAQALKVTAVGALPAVAQSYRAHLETAPEKSVLQAAKEYSYWLAEKCRSRGPGAVADSGEAHICALLDELCLRLRRSNK